MAPIAPTSHHGSQGSMSRCSLHSHIYMHKIDYCLTLSPFANHNSRRVVNLKCTAPFPTASKV